MSWTKIGTSWIERNVWKIWLQNSCLELSFTENRIAVDRQRRDFVWGYKKADETTNGKGNTQTTLHLNKISFVCTKYPLQHLSL